MNQIFLFSVTIGALLILVAIIVTALYQLRERKDLHEFMEGSLYNDIFS